MSTKEVNQTELAQLLGKTTRQIRNYEAQGIPHRAEGNRKLYPVPDAIQWFVEKKNQELLSDIEKADYKQARARRETARARMAEIELAKEESRLISRDVVEDVYGEMLDRVRAGLMNMPGRWGAQLTGLEEPREGEAVLKRAVSEILEDMSGTVADELAAGASIDLPEDFPGRSALVDAGIETIADVLALEELQEIHGVGPATEEKIEEHLASMGHDAA